MSHNNPFILGLTAVNEVHNCMFSILDDIIDFFYRGLCDIMCLMLTFWFLPVFFLMKGSCCGFYTMNYMLGLGTEYES